MKILTILILLAFPLVLAPASMLAAGPDERPRLEDYPSYYSFLEAMQAWNRANTDHKPRETSRQPEPNDAPATALANIDPTSELAPPPFEITGPENLDSAIERARSISHPDYKEKKRYRRTTHLSFPLPSIDGSDMSQASVEDTLSIKGKTEAEKKAILEKLTAQMDLEQRKLNETAMPDGSARPASTMPPGPNVLAGGGTSRVDITVSGH